MAGPAADEDAGEGAGEGEDGCGLRVLLPVAAAAALPPVASASGAFAQTAAA